VHRFLIVLAVASACGHSSRDTADANVPTADALSGGDGSQTCSATEICDGVIDDNCDGQVDEGCGRCPLLAVSCPTGCCAVPSWQIAQQDATGASIAVDDAGNIYVLYTVVSESLWHVWFAKYDAVPGTWSNRDLGATGTYRNRIAIDHLGRLHLLHGQNEGALYYDRSDDGGQTFEVSGPVGSLAIGGVFDLAVDSTNMPHVVWDAPQSNSFSQLTYATYDGTWHAQPLDLTTTQSAYPSIAIGFADRPHIVTQAYRPEGATGTSKRYIYFDGNQWRYQNIEIVDNNPSSFSGDSYFSAQSLMLAADDSATVVYTKNTSAAAQSLMMATRPAGDAGTWTTAPVTGVTSFENPSLVRDQAGALFAVSDGVALQRGATWQTTPVIAGNHAAAFRRQNVLYIVYDSDSAGGMSSLQLTIVPL
jgi:hypothetical protein